MNESRDANGVLKSLIDALQAEWTQMQIMGRALTAEEQQRSERIDKALPLLREAYAVLTGTPAPETA